MAGNYELGDGHVAQLPVAPLTPATCAVLPPKRPALDPKEAAADRQQGFDDDNGRGGRKKAPGAGGFGRKERGEGSRVRPRSDGRGYFWVGDLLHMALF